MMELRRGAVFKTNIYEKAWRLLVKKIGERTGNIGTLFKKEELQKLMLDCLTDPDEKERDDIYRRER